MANIKSQKKRNRTNEKARIRNKAIRSELKTVIKEVHKAVEALNIDEAQKQAQRAARLLDKAVTKGVIHKNQAANRKHGIQVLVNDLKKTEKGTKAQATSSAKGAKKEGAKGEKKPAAKTAAKPASKSAATKDGAKEDAKADKKADEK